MVYQPKFYYRRMPTSTTVVNTGHAVEKETLVISATAQQGLKLHPLFKNASGEELDYVLISAYEGTLYDASSNSYWTRDVAGIDFDNDKLSSVRGYKPISGQYNNLTVASAEKLANNRGPGWHITNMAFESAMQMLFMVEYNTPNGQNVLGKGVSTINDTAGYNCAAYTGSTASLGNTSGSAAATTREANGTETTSGGNGYSAISYRGMENPWGNIWRFIGGALLNGDGSQEGGVPYICTDFNYTNELGNNYNSLGFRIPSGKNWISNFCYPSDTYDWVFLPIGTKTTANSALPIGDIVWASAPLRGTNFIAAGGTWRFDTNNGLFYYCCDQAADFAGRAFGARLMFIPTKNSTYTQNIASWNAQMGG